MNLPRYRKAISILLVLLFTVSILGCGTDLDKTYSLSGQVVNHTGEGMGGVELTFGEQYDTVITDNNGFWEKDGLQDEVIVFPSSNKAVFVPVKKVFTTGEDNVNFILFNEMERGMTSSSGTFVAHSNLSTGEEVEVTVVVNDEITGKPIEGIEAEVNINGETIVIILHDLEGLYYPEIIILDMNNLEDYPDIEITRGSLFVKMRAYLKPIGLFIGTAGEVYGVVSFAAGGIAVATGAGALPGLALIAKGFAISLISGLLIECFLYDDGDYLSYPVNIFIYESRDSKEPIMLKIPTLSTVKSIDDAIKGVVGDRKYETFVPETNPAGAYYNKNGTPKFICIYICNESNTCLDFGTITWEVKGHGNGTYTGDMKNCIPHGQGIWTNAAGEEYAGEWKDGYFHENSKGWLIFGNSSDNYYLYKISTDGTGLTALNNYASIPQIVDSDWVYYTNIDDNGSIYKIRLDGTENTKFNNRRSDYLDFDEEYIYSYCPDDGNTYRVKKDGTEESAIIDQSPFYTVDNGWITYDHGTGLGKIRTDGTGKTMLINLYQSTGDQLVVDGDWIYYDIYCESLCKIRTDGTSNTKLIDGCVTSVTLTEDAIYYTSFSDNHNIYKMNKDGTGNKRIGESIGDVLGIDAEWIYFSTPDVVSYEGPVDQPDGGLYKMRLDGTNEMKLYDFGQEVQGIKYSVIFYQQ